MWGGLLKSMIDSDLHIILDVVKSSKNSRYNRNKIAGNGEPIWLTIPFIDFKREKLIKDQNLDTSSISKNNIINTFSNRYKNTTYFNNSQKILKKTLNLDSNQRNLCKIYKNFLNGLKSLGIPICNIEFASEILNEDDYNNLNGINLINYLLKKVDAETYLGSENTINYASPSDYCVNKVWIQKFYGKPYFIQQNNNDKDFIPNLSILDMLSYLDIEQTIQNLDMSNSWLKDF